MMLEAGRQTNRSADVSHGPNSSARYRRRARTRKNSLFENGSRACVFERPMTSLVSNEGREPGLAKPPPPFHGANSHHKNLAWTKTAETFFSTAVSTFSIPRKGGIESEARALTWVMVRVSIKAVK
jgi:hypothetical protein